MSFKENLVIEEASALAGITASEFIAKSAYIRAKHLLAQRSRFAFDEAGYSALRRALETSSENWLSTRTTSTDTNFEASSHRTEKLEIRHRIDDFDCGNEGLNTWLKRLAFPYQLMEIAETYVIKDDRRVIGYYTLREECFQVPDRDFSLATTLLLHLGVDKQSQGKGFGQTLVQNAINRFVEKQGPTSAKLMLVQAERISLQSWYQKMGFNPLTSELPILFLCRS